VMCQDHSAVASSVELVLNQRLVRRLCQKCSSGSAGKGAGAPGNRCPVCLGTGYRGRLPLVEWLRVNDAMRRSIAARELDGLVAQHLLLERAQTLVKAGHTNQGELNRILGF